MRQKMIKMMNNNKKMTMKAMIKSKNNKNLKPQKNKNSTTKKSKNKLNQQTKKTNKRMIDKFILLILDWPPFK